MIRAAGIMFLAPDNTSLFLKRSADGDCEGMWCFPGGKIEEGETAQAAAVRETLEEAGHRVAQGQLSEHTRTIRATPGVPPTAPVVEDGAGGSLQATPAPEAADIVDFTTFLVLVKEQFTPELNSEHTGYAWAPISDPPGPIHPGCQVAIDRLGWDELGVARAMAAGQLASPQVYENLHLYDMRITGTGVAFRSSLGEFVQRDPAIYMNDEFLARCNGLAVIYEHPPSATLTSKEFGDRVVGSILLPYLKPDAAEVWGIAKVYDEATIRDLNKGGWSTSPAVVFRDPSVNTKLTLEDGSPLLIEGKPSLLDHLAICANGVWDKGGPPSGIIVNDSQTGGTHVADEDDKKTEDKADAAKADAAKADAARADMSRKMDSLLAGLDSMSARMDAMEASRADAAKADADEDDDKDKDDKPAFLDKKKDSAKADADEDDDKKADADEDDDKPKEVVADKKKDSDEDMDDKKADAARTDSMNAIERRISDVERLIPRQIGDAEYHSMAEAQAKADSVFQAFGDSAPRPLNGEDLSAYRRRLASKLKTHSKVWGEVNIHAIADAAAFDAIETGIYTDAMAAAMAPATVEAGTLREIRTSDITGRVSSTFAGEPSSWMSGFSSTRRRVAGIRTGA